MTTRTTQQQQEIDQIRRKLADGFSSVRASETTNGMLSLSIESIIAQRIQEIEEDESDIRPGRLSEVLAIKQNVLDAIEAARNLPPELFSLSDTDILANTEE